ncbi:MAG: amidohydrolase family protein [Ruminococcus sp.]|nr:amidohydrolase family protein [Ruminococcus sp.]
MVKDFTVIDSHCHIYPEKIAAKAVGGTDNFYDIVSKCLGTTEDLVARGKKAGIDHFIVQSVATTPKQVKSINEFIAMSVKESNGLFTGLGTLHPDSENQRADVEHLVELSLKGIKLHPDIQQFAIDDERCIKIYELCEEFNLPVLMHTGDNRYDYSNPNRLLPVLKRFKNLTVIGAHFGGWSIWEDACKEYAGIPNFYVDCSSSLYAITPEAAKKVVRTYGAQHVLFATDYPMWDPSEEIERFLAIGLTKEENEMIFSKNVRKIFDIKL